MIEDLQTLYLSPSREVFESGVKLFRQKWVGYQSVISYMNQQWLTTHRNWFASNSKYPATNNALESFNRQIKCLITKFKKMPLKTFLPGLADQCQKWSLTQNFVENATVCLEVYTKAVQWANSNVQIIKNSQTEYTVAANMGTAVRAGLPLRNWREFGHLKRNAFLSYSLTIPEGNWQDGWCTCPHCLKHNVCKHLVGMAIKLGVVSPPLAASQIAIGKKRGRGRPKKVTRALVMD